MPLIHLRYIFGFWHQLEKSPVRPQCALKGLPRITKVTRAIKKLPSAVLY
jgi:hypothetical protein